MGIITLNHIVLCSLCLIIVDNNSTIVLRHNTLIYTAACNYSYMISNDAGHNQVFITENDCPGIDRENHR